MRFHAMVGASVMSALLLGGCPVLDHQTEPGPAPVDEQAHVTPDSAGDTPAPVENSPGPGPGESTLAVDPADDQTSADGSAPNETSGSPTTGEEGGDGQPVPDEPLPIPPGRYSGPVFVCQTAHCTGLFATLAGPEIYNETEWPSWSVVITADGLPMLHDHTLDMGGLRVDYMNGEVQITDDGVIVTWLTQVNFVNPATGEVFFSMPGTETDVYRVTEASTLQLDFLLTADFADERGTVDYQLSMIAEFSKAGG